MRRMRMAAGILLMWSGLWSGVAAAAEDVISPAQQQAIETIIAEYVSGHPEIIVAAMKKLEAEQAAAQQHNVQELGRQIISDPMTPYFGTKGGSHYIVEFFDFNCGYCKHMEPFLEELAKDKTLGVQIAYVNYPLLAQSSIKAATVGLAVHAIDAGKYFDYHRILMSEKLNIEDTEVLKGVLKRVGVSYEDVVAQIEKSVPQKAIEKNIENGRTLSVAGTPYFIIDGREYRGAFRDLESLRAQLTQ